MEDALHDLCQPLTALQCRLFLATLVSGEDRAEEMEQAVEDALRQCERAIGLVRAMQDRTHDKTRDKTHDNAGYEGSRG